MELYEQAYADARKTIRSTTMLGFGVLAILCGLAALSSDGTAGALVLALLGVGLIVGGLVIRP
jgi:uncharacterized membrane protein HdeD (DUF308 family)